jgi:predicted metal-dependent peptidase
MKNDCLIRDIIRDILLEELTSSDKKSIEQMAKKQAKILFDREISSAIEKEIKKRNGAFDKQANDVVTSRFKNAKSDKDFDEAVIKISKRVLKALHDMHYKRSNLIDKMPVSKS